MNKELPVIPNNELPANTTQTTFSQVGNDNIQVAHANNVNTVIIMTPATNNSNGTATSTGFALSNEYYSLFVIGDETFDGTFFMVEKDRALTIAEGIATEISEKYAKLDDAAIMEIKTFPALFMSENHQYGRTDPDHRAYFGFITDIKVQDNGIKIYFNKYLPIPQQLLNENMSRLAIKGKSGFNELNRTHWAIKRIDLLHELKAAALVPAHL